MITWGLAWKLHLFEEDRHGLGRGPSRSFGQGPISETSGRSSVAHMRQGGEVMVLKLRSFGLLFACTSALAVAGVVSAQPPAPTADRPHLAKDAKQAMDFLATWARVMSGEEFFKEIGRAHV